ncbi:diacylglycerol O-acyltransferase 2-like [Adelges cooleyi]|uniref:diacylglycerol O-acyltransferase 2-like n=1 Tax=Adelges cooleyi TaxID=133065 RepID=UPI00217FA78E|nr:diacylglycerol O-acyltransferase 2-like [Adelges cooleyi]
MKFPEVKFAPLFVPLNRRMETLVATIWIMTILFSGITGCTILWYVLIATRLWWLGLLYILWIIFDNIGSSDKKRFTFIRDLSLWHYLRRYFPVSLVKTHDLSADKSYLFATFPHGVICPGVFCNFSTNASPFARLFPSLSPYVITLAFAFNIPLHREIAVGLGFRGASEKSLINILDKKKGNVAVLIVGGVDEALNSFPGPVHIVVNRRKGFVRVALKTGASLVPVFSFGENYVYDKEELSPNSLAVRLSKFINWKEIKYMPKGRGMFQYSFGITPRRHPITTVVGKPIDVPKIQNPTTDDIEKYHKIFVDDLVKLFEEHKTKYMENAENINIVLDEIRS